MEPELEKILSSLSIERFSVYSQTPTDQEPVAQVNVIVTRAVEHGVRIPVDKRMQTLSSLRAHVRGAIEELKNKGFGDPGVSIRDSEDEDSGN